MSIIIGPPIRPKNRPLKRNPLPEIEICRDNNSGIMAVVKSTPPRIVKDHAMLTAIECGQWCQCGRCDACLISKEINRRYKEKNETQK